MAAELPRELSAIFYAPDAQAQETAWERFVAVYGRLVLHAAQSLGRDYDAAMDRYAFVLERLHEGDFHRLRAYTADGRAKFSTWLMVVARRLCLDHHRQRYGRSSGASAQEGWMAAEKMARRRLVDGIGELVDETLLHDDTSPGPDTELESSLRQRHLDAVLASLTPEDRLVLKLRFEDDLAAREIADVIGFPTPFHVYRRLNTLLGTLRTALRRRGLSREDI